MATTKPAEIRAGLAHPIIDADGHFVEVAPIMNDEIVSYIEEDGGMNFRINAFTDRDGVACVIRSLPRTVPSMETLGFPDEEVLHSILHLSQGLVVIPTDNATAVADNALNSDVNAADNSTANDVANATTNQ